MFLFGKAKLNKQVNDLNLKYSNLKNNDLYSKMGKLKMISENNEEYVELYTAIEANYNSLVNDFFLEIEEGIKNLENSINIVDSKILKADIKSVSDKIAAAEFEMRQILNQVSNMFEQENEIRSTLTPIKEDFRRFNTDYNQVSIELGECSVLFNDAIKSMEQDIIEIDEHLNAGQYKEAKEILNRFKVTLEEYNQHLKVMPQMVSFVFKTLPARYDAVVETYEEMKQEGYILFSIKMGTYQDEIESLFKSIKQAFYELKYNEYKDKIKELTFKINEIGVKLNKEKEAKDNFDSNNDRVYAFIDEINKNFLKSKRDFYSVNGVYLVDKSKDDELIFIENELHALSRVKMELETYLHSPTKYPYSTLNAKMLEIKDFSDSINAKVNAFHAYIYSLKEDSQYAYKYINDASVAITYYYNLLLSYNHKVLSHMYKDRYDEITGFIDVISKELVTKPIFVEKINEELKVFKSRVTTLLEEMKESVKMYNSASNIIIYTNKYRSSFSAVNDILNRAQIHFDNGEFEFAIDSVSEILQQVHPQAYAEMVKYKEENHE